MARILIVGGGCPGRRLAELMVAQGHAVRATTRSEARRSAIEATGAECWVGTPDRLATLRGALENVTIACWMLARASASEGELAALHSSRLEFFLGQAIDTTVRGLIYDARPAHATEREAEQATELRRPGDRRPSRAMLGEGASIFRSLTELNSIPSVVLGEGAAGAEDGERTWLTEAQEAVESLLDRRR
ncbi:MAG TPA: hypothetical protein VN672_08420 [Solirubrobacteraceae bacterium]|nr:hypothetical protein [Solirubrobacteraceae bacterium]